MAIRIERIIIIILSVMLFSVWQVYAGTPAGPGTPPGSTSSYTLSDIYNRLNDGTTGSQSTFTEPSVVPGVATMHTLNEIYDLIGLRSFVPKTGQTTCYDASGSTIPCAGTGQDGEYQKGVAWPNPRFTDNSDGTVTDNLTGLIWLKDANCFGTQTWAEALSSANGLANGACGLTDGSNAGNWRLPNVQELHSLTHYGFSNFALPNTAGTGQWSEGDPFTGVDTYNYWSSSTYTGVTTIGWYVNMDIGWVYAGGKTSTYEVWPVKGGQ